MGLWPVTRSHSQHRANDTKALTACSKTSRMNWDPQLLKIPAPRHLLQKPTLCQQKEQMKPRAHRGDVLINPRTGRTSVSPSITISTRMPQNTMKDNDSNWIIIQMSLDGWKQRKKQIVKRGQTHTHTQHDGYRQLINQEAVLHLRRLYSKKHAWWQMWVPCNMMQSTWLIT